MPKLDLHEVAGSRNSQQRNYGGSAESHQTRQTSGFTGLGDGTGGQRISEGSCPSVIPAQLPSFAEVSGSELTGMAHDPPERPEEHQDSLTLPGQCPPIW